MNAAEFVDKLTHLPPNPQILNKLLDEVQNPNVNLDRISEYIQVDASLASRVLTLSNSSYYGYSIPAEDLSQAIARIGFNEVYQLVSLILSKTISNKPIESYGLHEGDSWENSVSCALHMEQLSSKTNINKSIAYTIGLLHSLGKLAMGFEDRASYEGIFEAIKTQNCSLIEAEQSIFGFNHAEAGMALLKKWGFKALVYEPIGYQYDPLNSPGYSDLSAQLHLSLWLTAISGQNFGREAWAFTVNEEVLKNFNLAEDEVQSNILAVHEKLIHIKQSLQV